MTYEEVLVIWSDIGSASTKARTFDRCNVFHWGDMRISSVEENLDECMCYDKIILQRLGGNKYQLSKKEKDLIYWILDNHPNVHFDIDDLCINCDVSNFIKLSKVVRVASERLGELVKHINPNIEVVENIVVGDFGKSDLIKNSGKTKVIVPSDWLCDYWLAKIVIPECIDLYYCGSMKCDNKQVKQLGHLNYYEYLSAIYSCDLAFLPISSKDKHAVGLGLNFISGKSKIKQDECRYVATPLVTTNLVHAFKEDNSTTVIPESWLWRDGGGVDNDLLERLIYLTNRKKHVTKD